MLCSCSLKIPDSDLFKRRVDQKVDPVTNEVYIKFVYDPSKNLSSNETKQETFGKQDKDEEEANEDDKPQVEESVEEDEFSDDLVSCLRITLLSIIICKRIS